MSPTLQVKVPCNRIAPVARSRFLLRRQTRYHHRSIFGGNFMSEGFIVTAVVGVVALTAGLVPEFNSAFEVLGITAFFVLLFGGSAVLFREADRAASPG